MSLVALDGFEYGSTTLVSGGGAGGMGWTFSRTITETGGHVSGRYFNSAFGSLRCVFDSAGRSRVILGFAFRTTLTDRRLIDFHDSAGTVQCSLHLTAGGVLAVARSTTTIVYTSTLSPVAGAWNYIEVDLPVSDAATVRLRLNGGTAQSSGAVDILQTANANIAGFQVAQSTGDYDDVYVLDPSDGTGLVDFLGPQRIIGLRPDGAGTDTGWTLGAGTTKHEAVDDVDEDDDASYITSSVLNDKYSATLGDLPAGTTTVNGLYCYVRAEKTAADARAITPFLVNASATEHDLDELALAVGYGNFGQLFAESPFTSATWTPAEVNGLSMGVEVTV